MSQEKVSRVLRVAGALGNCLSCSLVKALIVAQCCAQTKAVPTDITSPPKLSNDFLVITEFSGKKRYEEFFS